MTHPESSFPPLVDTKRAAEISGLGENLLVSLRKAKTGPKCIKIGRQYFYDQEALVTWRKNVAL